MMMLHESAPQRQVRAVPRLDDNERSGAEGNAFVTDRAELIDQSATDCSRLLERNDNGKD